MARSPKGLLKLEAFFRREKVGFIFQKNVTIADARLLRVGPWVSPIEEVSGIMNGPWGASARKHEG